MKTLTIALGLILTLVLAVSLSMSTSRAQTANTLDAVRVEEGSMDPFDALWASAPTLAVGLIETGAELAAPAVTEVTLSAAYNDTDLWIRATWTDDTMNTGRRSWTWNGSGWVNNGGNEDRLGLMFSIAAPTAFETAGCWAACHIASEPNYMGFPADSTNTADLWHWKAGRTAPAGYSDDQWVGIVDLEAEEVTGRANDAAEGGGYSDNSSEAGDSPAFIYAPDALYGGALNSDTAVAYEGQELPVGHTVPGYLTSRPVGSRGDIESGSFYVRSVDGTGRWFVVLHRAMDTAQPDDAVFAPGNSYVFGVAVFNDGGGKQHGVSPAALLLSLAD
jgi:hypothetical protein